MQNEQEHRKSADKSTRFNELRALLLFQMQTPSKPLEQIVFISTPKTEEHMLIVMDISTHDETLSQPVHTGKKLIKLSRS